MNAIGPPEEPGVAVDAARNVRHGWRAPISIVLLAAIIMAIVAVVGWH